MNCECTGFRGETRLDRNIPKAKQISVCLERQIPTQELTRNNFQNLVANIAAEVGYSVGALWLNGANVAENGDYSTIYKPLTIRDALGLRFNLFFYGEF